MNCPRCGLDLDCPKEPVAFYAMRGLLDELPDISVRAFNCLRIAGIKSVDELVSFGPIQLLRLRNFGEGALREIIDLLEAKGLQLREPTAEEKHYAAGRRIWNRVQKSRPTHAERTAR